MPSQGISALEEIRPIPTISSIVRSRNGCIQIPEYDVGDEEVSESAFFTVFSRELSGNGDTPIMEFKGQTATESKRLQDAFSVFYAAGLRCHDLIRRSRNIVSNLTRCLSVSCGEESVDTAFRQGGAEMDRLKTDVSVLFTDLLAAHEKGKPPRQGPRSALYSDTEFLHEMTNGICGGSGSYDDDNWASVRNIMERHRAISRMQCKLYTEVLLDSTDHPDGVVSPDEGVGVRYSFWLINKQNDRLNGDCNLLSFDHGIDSMVTSNRARRDTERRQALARQESGKRGRDDDVDVVRFQSEKKFCLYYDLLRNTYPNIYGILSVHSTDMVGETFRSEFAVPGHSQIDKMPSVYRKIVRVSDKKLLFHEKHRGEDVVVAERSVSCRFRDQYSAMLSIMKKHRSMQLEQQDTLSYMRSDGPNGIDAILHEMVLVARVLTEPMFGIETSADGALGSTEFRANILDRLHTSVDQKEMIPFDTEEVCVIMDNLEMVDSAMHAAVDLLMAKKPWVKDLICESTGDVTGPNPWHSLNSAGDLVCFKSFLRRLNADGLTRSSCNAKRIIELREQLTCMNHRHDPARVDAIRAELASNESDQSSNYTPCLVLKKIVSAHPEFEKLSHGLYCDTATMPEKVVSNCFFEIHIAESHPNLDMRFIDGERREFFMRTFKSFIRSSCKARAQLNMFTGDTCAGGGMISGIHGQLQDTHVSGMRQSEIVHTEAFVKDVELHIITDLTKSSPLYLWGLDCAAESDSWKTRFLDEGIANYEDSYSQMLMTFADTLFNEVYTRDDMCARSCALREGAMAGGVFGSVLAGTLQRVQLVDSYDVTMEASANAKQLVLNACPEGWRQSFTPRPSLQILMVILTSGDPTVGEGTARRQPVHGNLLGAKGLGKSMIEDMMHNVFFKGYVVKKGKSSAAAHRGLSKKESLHCGADLMDEGSADDRASQKPGQNQDTGTDAAESKKERMSSGESRYTMAYTVQLPSGETAIGTHVTITQCKQVLICSRNDTVAEMLGPLADRCVNLTLKHVHTDISPDEYAADEPVYNSDEYKYQERVRCNTRLFVGQTLVLINVLGALSGFAKCIPGVDVSTLSFMRSAIARVLERNGQPRFPPRMTNKVIEMMKVSSMMGVALQVFWEPWGLSSEKAVKMLGGPRSEFTVQDLVRDPQMPLVGMCYCDFQDALSAYIQLLNQDRIDEVNAVRDAFIELIKSARVDFWDLFGEQNSGAHGGQDTVDLNVVKIAVDQNAKTDRQTMWCLANKLKKGSGSVSGGGSLESFSADQIIEILAFIMDDEQHAYQRHPDTLDVLIPDECTSGSGGSMCESVSFTIRNLREYNKIITSLAGTCDFTTSLHTDKRYMVTKDKINAVGAKWRSHGYNVSADSPGRMYFPNALSPRNDEQHLECDYVSDDMIDVKTLCLSTAVTRGYITVSSNWLFDGMRRRQNAQLTEVSLQQQIVEEVAHSATNSGFYATQGIGMSNIKMGAPHCQDIFYVGFKNKDCTIQNTNYISSRNHRMHGDSAGELPAGMQNASKRREPLVPDSLQDGLCAWGNMARSSPTVMINEHFIMHCDKRAILIVAPYMLQQAERVYTRWCQQGKEIHHRFRTSDGRMQVETLTFTMALLHASSATDTLVMSRKYLEEVLLWMFDTAPTVSEFGYRHLCRHYLHAEDIIGGADTGRDMHKSVYKEKLFKRFKFWLCAKLIALYDVRGEGQLMFNAINKTTSGVIRESRDCHLREFNSILQQQRGINYVAMSIQEISKLNSRNGELVGEYTFTQNQLRLKIIADTKEIEATNRRNSALRQQISKEVGSDAHTYKSYIESRSARNDRPGAHSGKEYLAYIRKKSTELHTQRQIRWPGVVQEYN